jgi:hypothetical protein
MNSEEQPIYIGECPDCDSPLYLIGDKVRYHYCPYQHMDELVDRITHDYVLAQLKPHKLEKLVKDILYVK